MRTDEDDGKAEDDETTPCTGDDLAGKVEIQEAIKNLYRNESAKKRLVAIAALILRVKPQLKRQYQPEDLFQEALERIAIGVRAWPKNRVDFPGLIIGVMRSWASSLEKTMSREDNRVVMEHELASADDGDGAPNLEEKASDFSTPLEHLVAEEVDAQGQALLAILKAQYDPQELPAKILTAILEKPFETHEEIYSALGVKEADYRNGWKVLMRTAKKLEPKE